MSLAKEVRLCPRRVLSLESRHQQHKTGASSRIGGRTSLGPSLASSPFPSARAHTAWSDPCSPGEPASQTDLPSKDQAPSSQRLEFSSGGLPHRGHWFLSHCGSWIQKNPLPSASLFVNCDLLHPGWPQRLWDTLLWYMEISSGDVRV